jgi:hypothetical protein
MSRHIDYIYCEMEARALLGLHVFRFFSNFNSQINLFMGEH